MALSGRRLATPGNARAAAFRFLLAARLVAVDGYLTESALRTGDARAVTVAGRTRLAVSAIGSAVIPRSGFPVALPIGLWLLQRGRALDSTGTRVDSAARAADTTRRAGDDH